MECPYCANEDLCVTNKRNSPQGIRRRRECLKCKKRFTTYEKIEKNNLFIIKKDGRRESFQREKLANGVRRAFEKRPVPNEVVEKIIGEIEENLRKKGKMEIKSSLIGECVMKRLKKVDNVAYIRFASVYKDFQDISDFKNAINEVK